VADRQAASKSTGQAPGRAAQKERLATLADYVSDASAAKFDRLIHERIRLGIMSALAVNSTLGFTDLKDLLRTTDGNLSVHARRLEDAGYIACTKSFEGRFPRTEYRLTSTGRKALERYLAHMEALIRTMRGA